MKRTLFSVFSLLMLLALVAGCAAPAAAPAAEAPAVEAPAAEAPAAEAPAAEAPAEAAGPGLIAAHHVAVGAGQRVQQVDSGDQQSRHALGGDQVSGVADGVGPVHPASRSAR